MKFLEKRPCLEQFERVDTTVLTWVATVAGGPLCIANEIEEDLKRVVYKQNLIKENSINKFLMVTSPNGTQAFVSWTRGVQNCTAKAFLKKVFGPFGAEVERQALKSLQPMNTRHEMQIKNGY